MLQEFLPDSSARVVVAGDVILDRYVFGAATRISPEAPVPIVAVNKSEERAGGAANVAVNIRTLGINTQLVGLVGEDAAAGDLERILSAAGVDHHLQQASGVPTITKMRVISQHQQLLRLDYESLSPVPDTAAVMRTYAELLSGAGCVVLSDYGKGCLNRVQDFIQAARGAGVPVYVDPKGRDFSRYRGATLLTPNLREFEAVVGDCRDDDIEQKGRELCRELDLEALLITRGDRGMTLIQPAHNRCLHLPARAHEVFDVTGAGDTVIAALAAATVSGFELPAAAEVANAAAGLVVERLGTASVSAGELNARMSQAAPVRRGPVSRSDLAVAVEGAKRRGEKIVMTNGCFDLLHAGHVQYLQRAKSLGDRLVVAVNDDASVRRLKGETRPINALEQRMAVLGALSSVDWVAAFSEDTPQNLVEEIRPDVLVKGGDYEPEQIAGADSVRQYGGEVLVLPFEAGCSTSAIIDSIGRGR